MQTARASLRGAPGFSPVVPVTTRLVARSMVGKQSPKTPWHHQHAALLSQRRHGSTAIHVLVDDRGTTAPTTSLGAPKPSVPTPGDASGLLSYAALFGVAVLWGSYPPALKILYANELPPDPPLMNAMQACLSAAFLVAATLTAKLTGRTPTHPERMNPLMAEDSAVLKATLRRERDALKSGSQGGTQSVLASIAGPPRRTASNLVEHAIAEALTWRSNSLLTAGAEIGLWMSLAFGLEVAGLQLTSATKVAFLNQVSVLITPLLVHLSGERVRNVEWVACGMGLLGSILVAADSLINGGGGGGHGAHGAAVAAGQAGELVGMVFVLVSAVFFALSTVRLGRYSAQFDPLALSTASMCTLGLLSLGWVGYAVVAQGDGGASELAVVQSMLSSPLCVATLLWVGLGPGALAAYLQATGQKSVPPAQAQVIYSTTPLWAAGFALLALNASDEAMGSIAWIGAAVMLLASLSTAVLPPDTPSTPADAYPASGGYSLASLDSDSEENIFVGAGVDGVETARDRQSLRDVL